jgi:hypothetical protein
VNLPAESQTGLPQRPLAEGEQVFARSNDGKFYVADVIETEPGGVHVEFLRGGEITVAADQLRRCQILPGDKLRVNWPWWGPYTGTVVSFDAKREMVTLSDGWSEEVFELDQVWQEPPKTPAALRRERLRAAAIKALAVGGVGAAIGSLVTWLVMR